MSPGGVERKLTTILAADAAGYSAVMERDEVAGFAALQAARDVFARLVERHRGRIANTAGDGLIAEFPSAVEAVQCALEVQTELAAERPPPAVALRFRIGIHLGDVLVDDGDLIGEGVNLAARLQAMAEPGGILISRQVYDHVHAKLGVRFDYLGEKRPKNFSGDVAVYRVSSRSVTPDGPEPVHSPARAPEAPRRAAAVAPASGRARVLARARQYGAIWLVLAAIDLATGARWWAHWPGIAMLVLIGLEAAPLVARDRFSCLLVRGGVIVAMLAVINLVTWSGTLWAAWPAGALAAGALLRWGFAAAR